MNKMKRLAYTTILSAMMSWTAPQEASAQLGSLIVNMTSPASGSTVSGTVTVSASVTVIGLLTVQGVQFKLDGANLGAQDTSAPYSVSWNTTFASNGSHTLTAVATDVLGLQFTSNSVTVNVANAPPPDTTPPTVSITSPANGATVSGTITVTANAADNVGVAGVQFRVDGANVGAEDSAAPYSASFNTTAVANGSHTLSAVARDAAGNRTTSAGVTVSVSNGGAVTRIEEDNPAVSASPAGAWVRRGAEVATFSGGAAGSSDIAGATASLIFNGTAVSWIGLKCSICGIATVSIDGGAATSVDTAGPGAVGSPGLASEPVFTVSGLAAGAHTLVITVTGTTTTSGAHIVVDAFDVTAGGGSAATRIEENNRAVSASPVGAWAHRGAEVAAFSGGGADSSDVAGATATLTFTGTAVSWIGLKCSICGIATVSIDGGAATSVDTAGPGAVGSPGLASEPVFAVSGLAAGTTHTLVITVTGTTATSGAHIVVDAFDVTAGAGIATRFEDTDPAVSYTGAWAHGTDPRASSGTYAEAQTAGATGTFSFTGTGVRWNGLLNTNNGIARVSVDGVFKGEVDTYAPSFQLAVVFASDVLPRGAHTLTIEVTGSRNPASTDTWVLIDAFDVTP